MSSDSSCDSPIVLGPGESLTMETLKSAMESLYHRAYEDLKEQTEEALHSALSSISSSIITPLAAEQQSFQHRTNQRLSNLYNEISSLANFSIQADHKNPIHEANNEINAARRTLGFFPNIASTAHMAHDSYTRYRHVPRYLQIHAKS